MEKLTLAEATNIGHELLAMGKITKAQLDKARDKYAEYINGDKPRFGQILKELGMVTDADLEEAEKSQQRSRDVQPSNADDLTEQLKILRGVVNAHEKATTTRLIALESAEAKK